MAVQATESEQTRTELEYLATEYPLKPLKSLKLVKAEPIRKKVVISPILIDYNHSNSSPLQDISNTDKTEFKSRAVRTKSAQEQKLVQELDSEFSKGLLRSRRGSIWQRGDNARVQKDRRPLPRMNIPDEFVGVKDEGDIRSLRVSSKVDASSETTKEPKSSSSTASASVNGSNSPIEVIVIEDTVAIDNRSSKVSFKLAANSTLDRSKSKLGSVFNRPLQDTPNQPSHVRKDHLAKARSIVEESSEAVHNQPLKPYSRHRRKKKRTVVDDMVKMNPSSTIAFNPFLRLTQKDMNGVVEVVQSLKWLDENNREECTILQANHTHRSYIKEAVPTYKKSRFTSRDKLLRLSFGYYRERAREEAQEYKARQQANAAKSTATSITVPTTEESKEDMPALTPTVTPTNH